MLLLKLRPSLTFNPQILGLIAFNDRIKEFDLAFGSVRNIKHPLQDIQLPWLNFDFNLGFMRIGVNLKSKKPSKS
ncbi:MAG: hypothetical protein ACI9WT_000949 [Flavobacterium sp.]|jgi:hypothetical protein